MKATTTSEMYHRKNSRRIREYLVWRREDLEGHDNCLQIFVGLDIVSVAPAAMTLKNDDKSQ